MMEVNHNTTLEFGDLLTSTSNSNDRVTTEENQDIADDDVMMTNLKSSFSKDTSKANDLITNGELAEINGANLDSTTVDLCGSDLDLDGAQITPELEDKLLADDDTDVVDKLLAEVVPSTILNNTSKLDEVKDSASVAENIQADNTETLRNPGDDLDTLLSKINDIVDDCIDPESVNSRKSDLISFDTSIKTNTENKKLYNELDESVILLDDSASELNDKKMEEESYENSLDTALIENDKTTTASQENIEEPKSFTANDEIATANQENLNETKSLIAIDCKTSDENQENLEQTNEPRIDIDEKSSIEKDPTKITESDQLILEVDLEDVKDKSDNATEKPQNDGSEFETKEVEENSIIENSSPAELNADFDNEDTKSEIEELEKDDEETTVLNKNEETTKPESKSVEPTTDKIPVSTPVISLDADDSDDDIVFFSENSRNSIDAKETKELESDQSKETENKTDDDNKVDDNVSKEREAANNIDDDDVVLLDDDEDENLTKPAQELNEAQTDVCLKPDTQTEDTTEKIKKSEIESTTDGQKETAETADLIAKKPSEETNKMLIDDNSDNAKDKFDVVTATADKKLDKEIIARADAEETNSNCSSSSNLLQEAKAVSEEGEEETDLGNEDDEDVGENESETAVTEVDIAEAEIAEDDSKEGEPPAKRICLSTDGDGENIDKAAEESEVSEDKKENLVKEKIENDNKSDVVGDELEDKTNIETDIKSDIDKTSLKRSLDSLESDEKSDLVSFTKKLKTDDKLPVEEVPEKKESTQNEIKLDIIEIPDGKEDDDEVKFTKPMEETSATTDMTEEITEVSPIKAVPSHVPIPLYPPPQFQESAAELNLDFLKRFKKSLDQMTKIDLEELILQKIVEAIIHKSEFGEMRELIEKQEKIIATHRTKITELSKQFRDLEMVHNRVLKDIEVKNSQFLMPVKITRAVGLQVFIPHKKTIEPPLTSTSATNVSTGSTSTVQHSPQNQYRALNNSGSQLTSPSRQNNSDAASNTATSSRIGNTVLASTAAAAAVNSRRGCVQKVTPQRPLDTSSNTSQQTSATYRTPQAQQSLLQQNPTKLLNKSVSSAPAQIRNRYSGPATVVQQQQQQQLARQQPSPTNQLRKISPAPPSAMPKSNMTQQYRRADSTPQPTTSTATIPENYMSSIHQLPPGIPTVSITPAKPKEKSVIDLTDEDDAPSSTSTATTSTVARRPPSGPNSSNTSGGSSNYVLNKLPTNAARLPPNQTNKAQTTARQQLASIMHGSKTNGNPTGSTNIPGVSTPPGTSITRIQLGNRKTYSHPAPLPPTPSQNLNPAWKLPPPRPTIRISNLDNGIVISWTVEESMDRHADCVSYQIYAYQETSGPPLIDSWRHVGDVKAMLLPMAVTLTQFQEGQRYYFAVRAVDVHHRVGPFSLPKTWG